MTRFTLYWNCPKGKLTTSPETHTGEGIFFTSKVFDSFLIRSYALIYLCHGDINFVSDSEKTMQGTDVIMEISTIS